MTTLLRTTSIAALALAPFITGCATKKFVRTTVTPIEQKVGALDTTATAHGKSIEELERGVSRADERAQGAQGKADAAQLTADTARKEAAEGRGIAERGVAAADQVGKDLTSMGSTINTKIENIQNYRLITTESVLFATNKSELTPESMATLDSMVTKSGAYKNFVVEVQGFTDSTGPKAMNLELSKRRAEAVVRYLTMKHNVPLHRIYLAGYGVENQAADNKTRDGRKQNRRVEMKVYVTADQAPNQVSAVPPTTN